MSTATVASAPPASNGGTGGGAILRLVKWRWIVKRVFATFSTPSSTSTSTSTSQPPASSNTTATTSSSSSSSKQPSTSRASPRIAFWDFRRFFSYRLLLLPAPPAPTSVPAASSSTATLQPSPKETPQEAVPELAPSPPTPSPPIQTKAPSPPPAASTSISKAPAAPSKPKALPPKRHETVTLVIPPPSPGKQTYSIPPPPPRQTYLSNLPPLPSTTVTMSDLPNLHTKIISSYTSKSHKTTLPLLASAKLSLLKNSALIPTNPSTPAQTLSQARDILEIGALTSIHLSDTESFSRYYNYLQPFYKLPTSFIPASQNEAKILGLYLLFLLSQGDGAGFHTALEVLSMEGTGDSEKGWQWGEYVRYPVTLERWLMEGSYDKVWEATRKSKTPTEEFDVFTKILVQTLRQEIATSAERAYPSLPVSNAKNLLFLDTEKDVLQFARDRDWDVRDGRIYFPDEEEYGDIPDSASVAAVRAGVSSGTIIENTIGYANELEQIV